MSSLASKTSPTSLPSPTYVPVDEITGVHLKQVKLVVESSPSLGVGGGFGEHADSPLDLGEIITGMAVGGW